MIDEMYNELMKLQLVEAVWAVDREAAQKLLTRELDNWSGQTCLSLAAIGKHQDLIAHPLCQNLLDDLWRGGLAASTSPNVGVVLALLLPPFIFR